MKNIEMVNYVNHIFLNRSSYKTFRDNYEFNDPNKVRWNGIPIPFLDIILDCGVDIVDIIINKGIELDSGEFIDCDTSDLEDVYNAINKFKESKKENQQDDIYFVKYKSYNDESNIVHGGILRMSLNGTYMSLSADFDLTFDPDHDNIIEAIKLDETLSALIRFIIKYSSNDEPYYIPEEKRNNNEYNDISDKLKNVKDFNCTFEKEDKDTFEWPTDGFRSFDDDTNKYMKGYASSFDPDKFGRKINGVSYIPYFPTVYEHYIDLNNDDVEYGLLPNHKDWKFMIGFCSELKTYIITATGGEETRAYAFVDKNYHILQKAELNEVCDMKEVIAPKGSVYLIVNSKNGPLNIVKK